MLLIDHDALNRVPDFDDFAIIGCSEIEAIWMKTGGCNV
jgi:diphthamide synthase subunit DPH2